MKKGIIKKIFIGVIFLIICFLSIFEIPTYAATTIDDTIDSAKSFINAGTKSTINETELKDTSDFLYNLLLGIGIIVAVIVGSILGIKYMVGSAEEKAEYKETLLVYLIGCIVVFGAFGIWKIIVSIFNGI